MSLFVTLYLVALNNASNASIEQCLQAVPSLSSVCVQNKAGQRVKRKLQFIPVHRYVIGPKWCEQ